MNLKVAKKIGIQAGYLICYFEMAQDKCETASKKSSEFDFFFQPPNLHVLHLRTFLANNMAHKKKRQFLNESFAN